MSAAQQFELPPGDLTRVPAEQQRQGHRTDISDSEGSDADVEAEVDAAPPAHYATAPVASLLPQVFPSKPRNDTETWDLSASLRIRGNGQKWARAQALLMRIRKFVFAVAWDVFQQEVKEGRCVCRVNPVAELKLCACNVVHDAAWPEI